MRFDTLLLLLNSLISLSAYQSIAEVYFYSFDRTTHITLDCCQNFSKTICSSKTYVFKERYEELFCKHYSVFKERATAISFLVKEVKTRQGQEDILQAMQTRVKAFSKKTLIIF